jgi:hypothetical protein
MSGLGDRHEDVTVIAANLPHRLAAEALGTAMLCAAVSARLRGVERDCFHSDGHPENNSLERPLVPGYGDAASGCRHRRLGKRAKSPSVVISSQPCSMASAARYASATSGP